MKKLVSIEELKLESFESLNKHLKSHIKSFNTNQNTNKVVDTYMLWLVYQLYKERNGLITKEPLYRSDNPVITIETGSDQIRNLIITDGMLYFYAEFTLRRLFNIPKNWLDELSDLNQLKNDKDIIDTDLENRVKEIERDISARISKASGLKNIIIKSESKLNNFRGLVKNSMKQFCDSIPSDNKILDREFNKALQILKGQSSNENVAISTTKALNEFGLEFIYKSGFPPMYKVKGINSNFEKIKVDKSENLFDQLSKVETRLPEFDLILNDFDYEHWRPYNQKSLVHILAITYLHQDNEYLSTYDLKVVFSNLLISAKKIHPEQIEIPTSEFIDEDINNPLDLISQRSGSNDPIFARFEEDNVYRELETVYSLTESILFEEMTKENIPNIEKLINKINKTIEIDQINEKVELFINLDGFDDLSIYKKILELKTYLPQLNFLSLPVDYVIFDKLKKMKIELISENE